MIFFRHSLSGLLRVAGVDRQAVQAYGAVILVGHRMARTLLFVLPNLGACALIVSATYDGARCP